MPCTVSINKEEFVAISDYGQFWCCFYVYCFISLILVHVPILINNYLAIVDFYFTWYLSNPSKNFNVTMSNEPNTRLSGMKQDFQDTTSEFTQSLAARLKGWEISKH